ncbi:MAG: archease [Candidatus Aenigmarchaeota archaeon]|nr:archease [Candidatus Aenigmarchaeota archaeon]
MPYKIREDIATADVAFEAEGATFEDMCASAAEALTSVMIKPETLKEKTQREFFVKGATPEKLLFNLLNEIIYLKDAELLVFKTFSLKRDGTTLHCTAKGDKLDYTKQTHGVDVKAVTYHMFQVRHENDKWKTFVILDI